MVLAVLFLLLSLLVAGFGAISLTQATLGVGAIAGACYLGILARIIQADHHHKHRNDAD